MYKTYKAYYNKYNNNIIILFGMEEKIWKNWIICDGFYQHKTKTETNKCK